MATKKNGKPESDGKSQRFPVVRLKNWAARLRKLAEQLEAITRNLEGDEFSGSLIIVGGDTVRAGLDFGEDKLVPKLQAAHRKWSRKDFSQWTPDESDPDEQPQPGGAK